MIMLFSLFLLVPLFSPSAGTTLVDVIRSGLKKYNLTHAACLYSEKGACYRNSVVLANYACKSMCPHVVVSPKVIRDIVSAVLMSSSLQIPLSVKGGGHGYTCQGTKKGGMMIDLSDHFTAIDISDDLNVVTIGAGLTWGKVLPFLKTYDRTVIHGQCLNVGVSGFSLHGGVHFGGLSELYGLGSENIVGLTAVVSNGSVVQIDKLKEECSIDFIHVSYGSCKSLFKAFCGAGSSFGIVTSLSLRTFSRNNIQSALSVLSVSTENSTAASNLIEAYMSNLPSHISVTLFGLDEYFKAYFFVAKFISDKLDFLTKAFSSFKRSILQNEKKQLHFVVEVSWAKGKDNMTEDMLSLINNIHRTMTSNVSGNKNHRLIASDCYLAHSMWSVPSYDLVWGAGHSYGGATVAVNDVDSSQVIEATMDRFNVHVNTKSCSDCVTVIHRIGEGLRHSHSQSSFNPSLQHAKVWIEIDCGLFHRTRGAWPVCNDYLLESQITLDKSFGIDIKSISNASMHHNVNINKRFHYPNVPSLATENWSMLYYGNELYEELQQTKDIWDPVNLFRHAQSVAPTILTTALNDQEIRVEKENNIANFSKFLSPEDWERDLSLEHFCNGVYDRKATVLVRLAKAAMVTTVTTTGGLLGLRKIRSYGSTALSNIKSISWDKIVSKIARVDQKVEQGF